MKVVYLRVPICEPKRQETSNDKASFVTTEKDTDKSMFPGNITRLQVNAGKTK